MVPGGNSQSTVSWSMDLCVEHAHSMGELPRQSTTDKQISSALRPMARVYCLLETRGRKRGMNDGIVYTVVETAREGRAYLKLFSSHGLEVCGNVHIFSPLKRTLWVGWPMLLTGRSVPWTR
jgi:hypothetical protein